MVKIKPRAERRPGARQDHNPAGALLRVAKRNFQLVNQFRVQRSALFRTIQRQRSYMIRSFSKDVLEPGHTVLLQQERARQMSRQRAPSYSKTVKPGSRPIELQLTNSKERGYKLPSQPNLSSPLLHRLKTKRDMRIKINTQLRRALNHVIPIHSAREGLVLHLFAHTRHFHICNRLRRL